MLNGTAAPAAARDGAGERRQAGSARGEENRRTLILSYELYAAARERGESRSAMVQIHTGGTECDSSERCAVSVPRMHRRVVIDRTRTPPSTQRTRVVGPPTPRPYIPTPANVQRASGFGFGFGSGCVGCKASRRERLEVRERVCARACRLCESVIKLSPSAQGREGREDAAHLLSRHCAAAEPACNAVK